MKFLSKPFASSGLLCATLAVLLISKVASAQSTASQVPATDSAGKGSGSTQNTASNGGGATKSAPDSKNTGTASSGSTGGAAVTITGAASATDTSLVVITGGATATTGGLTNLPKLPGQFSYPPASVPPTQKAPFMQASSLPDGTVFIAVGAVLGFLALSVLSWRGLTAWSLHRSVKRAATLQNMSDTKALFRTPAPPMYKYSDRESIHSSSNLGGAAGKGGKKGRPLTAGHSGAGAGSQSLFFSPTAGAAGAGTMNPGNRGSNYLPAGYYAAGASAPGNGTGLAHVGPGHGNSISLSNLGPHSQGYSRARSMGPSPPDSPRLGSTPDPGGPGHLGHRGNISSSTLELNRNPNGRAPSQYLDELFDEAGVAPGQYPGQRPSQSSRY